jgi:uncharacterized membrane protein YcfT
MTLDSLRLLRNILLRTAVISIACSYAALLATFAFWDTWAALTSQLFHLSPEALSRPVLLYFFVAVKFFNIFVLLAPALALHWTIKREMAGKAS